MRNKKIVFLAFAGLVLFNLAFGIAMLLRGGHDAPDPRLSGEQLAMARLQGVQHLFFSPSSHADLQAARPGLAADADEHSFARAVQNPYLFRALDHQQRFDAVLLSGDPTSYEPLLRHLGQSPDFVLTWLDNADLIFRRAGAATWTPADLDSAAAQFKGENHARFLAGAATRLIAIGRIAEAKHALDGAQPHGGSLPEYWTALALYNGKVFHWKEALDACDRALAIQPDFTPALTTKAQILFGAGKFDDALPISDKIVEQHPDDPSLLFLHANISHAAHSYDREIAALKHLIELADAQSESTTGYRIYLGQAYAETGYAMQSLVQFKKAIDSSDISEEQRKFAQECIDKIRAKTSGEQQASQPQ